MVSCFWGFRQKRKTVERPRPLTLPLDRSTSSIAPGQDRLDSLKSWSVLLDCQISGHGSGEVKEETEGAIAGGAQPEWVADMSELFIGNRFASGSNSRIYRGIYKQRAVAVKMVRVPDNEDGSRPLIDSQFNSEVALLSRLRHPNVIEFIAAYRKPPVYCIITEYMSQGTLRMYLHKKEPYSLSNKMILKFALDISRGMQYLHAQGIVHRDLKSNNLLLNDELTVKVVDFGISCLDTQCHATKGFMGTYRWMAPEMIRGKTYTKKVDVYSFGIVLWELLTALVPFQGMTPVQAAFAVSEKLDCCCRMNDHIYQMPALRRFQTS
ncbi:serine/threonine/tyrosine-protein kinase HT1-like isoform X2 [Nymphaea colorata]|uniref:serine/threonine/tyrosine-protein kinase HT1-like isoform X2 n=1 Tax=Nymphaea colorata TaxID=210225 RepID=UPI00129E9BCB|nr:serine/threonine/tyrosine-protein kinase HT1-like isoform X2 [Nymphaea colorata]